MTKVNVLVVFYSRYGETERLGMAAGVGAVQARADIRLRRLKDLADAETIARDPRWVESLGRMTADYIPPREIDADWADLILMVSCPSSPLETEQYLETLQSKPKESRQVVLIANDPADPLESVRAQARSAVEMARHTRS